MDSNKICKMKLNLNPNVKNEKITFVKLFKKYNNIILSYKKNIYMLLCD